VVVVVVVVLVAAMHSLQDLPSELLYNISAAVSPADLVSFASACKRLLDCSKVSLARHRDLHRELRVIHDRDALTVPTLLRRAMDDAHVLWHIRKFEVWGSRDGFSMWKNYRLDSRRPDGVPGPWMQQDIDEYVEWSKGWRNYTQLDYKFFDHRELARYRNFMLQELQMAEDDVEMCMAQLKFGCDEPLKVILLALSEGLRDLIYFYYHKSYNPGDKMSPLTMVSTSLRHILLSPPESRQWPVGFKALRSINIVERATDRFASGDFFICLAAVTPLFMLPAIAKLTLCGLIFIDDEAHCWEWDEHVSTVVDLELSVDFDHEAILPIFISACKALRSFAYDALLSDPVSKPLIRPSLLEHAKDSLEEIRIDPAPYHTLKNLDGLLTRFSILRHVWITDTCLFNWDAIQRCLRTIERSPESYDQIRAQWLDLREHMPRTLETLHIQFGQDHWPREHSPKPRAIAFCARMEEFVRSKNIQTGQLGKLRVLCIGHAFLCGKAKVDHLTPRASPFVVHDLLAPLRNACADNNLELSDVDDVRHDCGQCLNTRVVLEPLDARELYYP